MTEGLLLSLACAMIAAMSLWIIDLEHMVWLVPS